MQPPRHRVRRPADRRQIVRLQQRQPFLRREALAGDGFVENGLDVHVVRVGLR